MGYVFPRFILGKDFESHGSLRHVHDYFIARTSAALRIGVIVKQRLLDHASLSAPLFVSCFSHFAQYIESGKRNRDNGKQRVSMHPEIQAKPKRGPDQDRGRNVCKNQRPQPCRPLMGSVY